MKKTKLLAMWEKADYGVCVCDKTIILFRKLVEVDQSIQWIPNLKENVKFDFDFGDNGRFQMDLMMVFWYVACHNLLGCTRHLTCYGHWLAVWVCLSNGRDYRSKKTLLIGVEFYSHIYNFSSYVYKFPFGGPNLLMWRGITSS